MSLQKLEILGSYLDLLLDMLCVVDAQGHFLYVSSSVEQILGYQRAELLGRSFRDFVWPEDLARTLAGAAQVMQGEQLTHFENRYRHKAGHPVYLSWSARWSEKDQVRVALARDISELRRSSIRQQAMLAIAQLCLSGAEPEQLYPALASLLASTMSVQQLLIVQRERPAGGWHCRFVQRFASEQPFAVAEPLVAPGADLNLLTELWPDDAKPAQCLDWQPGWITLVVLNSATADVVLAVQADNNFPSQRGDEQAALLQYAARQLSAALERHQLLHQLTQQALYDSLTGLANRNLLTDRLQQACTRSGRDGQLFALIFVDLDNFKTINDRLGHQSGDQVLQIVAQRLRKVLRRSDTVARFGGDEFVVLLEPISTAQDAWHIADKIRQVLALPVELSGQPWPVSASIGLALYPEHGHDSSHLMMMADGAMYQAKYAGGDQVSLAASADPGWSV